MATYLITPFNSMAGIYKKLVGDQIYEVKAGDSVFGPRGVPYFHQGRRWCWPYAHHISAGWQNGGFF